MKFDRAKYDMSLGEPTVIFQARNINRVVLVGMLNVFVGNAGGIIMLVDENEPANNGKPSGVLYCMNTELPVGIMADDYDESRMFGILESDCRRISLAESLGEKIDLLTYGNSMRMLHS